MLDNELDFKGQETKKPARKRRSRFFLIILLVFIIAIGIMFYDSNTRIVTTEYLLHYANLPEPFDGFRIVVLADVHAAVFGENNARLIARVREASPDIIAIAGDLIDSYGALKTETQLDVAENLIAGLIEIAPIYYVTGNHEWDGGGIWPLLTMLDERGVTVLRNQYSLLEWHGKTIILAGTDDPNGPADMIKPDGFVKKIFEAEGDGFIVMLEHRNNNLQLYSNLGVDLVLCGHSHGGYIRLPFTDGLFGTQRDWFPTYTNGVYTMGCTNMVVSRGLGNHLGIPRFLNNPHIVVAVLRQ